MARGTLRVYLGAAPGVGKTYAMLNEGHRRHERGTDMVVAYVETHGRPRTAEQIGDLEVVPRSSREYRSATFEEMDVDAVLARHPEVALVDELAHTNAPGSRNTKRWQDVQRAPRRRHRRHLDRQHPASRIDQRRGRAHHRDRAARDDPRRDRPVGRPGGAGRHDARSAAAAHGARQCVRAREDRRRPDELLPRGQPRRPSRARAAVGRGPGRCRARGLPRPPRDHPAVGDARTRRRRHHRRARNRGSHPARLAHRTASARRAARRPRPQRARPGGVGHRAARGAPAAARGGRRRIPRGGRQRRRRRARRLRASGERNAAHPREQPPEPLERAHPWLCDQSSDPAVGDDRCARDLPRAVPLRDGSPPSAPPARHPRAPAAPARVASHPGGAAGAHTCAVADPRAHRIADRDRSLPLVRHRRRRDRRTRAGVGRRGRRIVRRELVLHAAHSHVDDRRRRERDRARCVPRHRRDRQRPRRARRRGGQPRPPGRERRRRPCPLSRAASSTRTRSRR